MSAERSGEAVQRPVVRDRVRRALVRLMRSIPVAADIRGGRNWVEYSHREWTELCAATEEAALVIAETQRSSQNEETK